MIAIIPTADRSKATVKVRIALKQKDPRIVPDMGVRGWRSSTRRRPRRPARTATGRGPGAGGGGTAGWRQALVFVYSEGKVERRRVTLGQSLGDERQVLSGLRAGERVVLSPPDALRDGASVKLAEGG